MRNEKIKLLVNSRIDYLDLARGLAIFFMVMQHALIIFDKSSGEGTWLGNVFLLLGIAPAAPVFLLIMGIFFAASKKTTAQNMIRGFKLILLGYVLNLLRFSLPVLLLDQSVEVKSVALILLMTVDILQLAGLSLLTCAFLKQYAGHRYLLPSLIIAILLISPYLWGWGKAYNWFNPLWGDGPNIEFPFFPWVVYFLFGLYLSQYWLDPNFSRLTKKVAIAGVILLLLGGAALNFTPLGDYHRSGLGLHLLIAGFIILWLLVCRWIMAHVSIQNPLISTIFFWSKNVTAFYIIQWIIYGWSSIWIIGNNTQSDVVSLSLGVGVLLLTHLLLRYSKISRLIPQI